MQTPPLRSGRIYIKDTHCGEPNEKLIFQFLFFDLWLIVFTIFKSVTSISKSVTNQKNKIRTKVTRFPKKMHNALKRIFEFVSFFCAITIYQDMVDFFLSI